MRIELVKEVSPDRVQPKDLIVTDEGKRLVVAEIRFDGSGVLIYGRPPGRATVGKRIAFRPLGPVTVIYDGDLKAKLDDLAAKFGILGDPEEVTGEVFADRLDHELVLTFEDDWQLRLETE